MVNPIANAGIAPVQAETISEGDQNHYHAGRPEPISAAGGGSDINLEFGTRTASRAGAESATNEIQRDRQPASACPSKLVQVPQNSVADAQKGRARVATRHVARPQTPATQKVRVLLSVCVRGLAPVVLSSSGTPNTG